MRPCISAGGEGAGWCSIQAGGWTPVRTSKAGTAWGTTSKAGDWRSGTSQAGTGQSQWEKKSQEVLSIMSRICLSFCWCLRVALEHHSYDPFGSTSFSNWDPYQFLRSRITEKTVGVKGVSSFQNPLIDVNGSTSRFGDYCNTFPSDLLKN